MRNKQTLVQANAIKAQRVIELTNNEAGVINKSRGAMLLTDWLKTCEERADKRGIVTSSVKLNLSDKLVLFKGQFS